MKKNGKILLLSAAGVILVAVLAIGIVLQSRNSQKLPAIVYPEATESSAEPVATSDEAPDPVTDTMEPQEESGEEPAAVEKTAVPDATGLGETQSEDSRQEGDTEASYQDASEPTAKATKKIKRTPTSKPTAVSTATNTPKETATNTPKETAAPTPKATSSEWSPYA